MLKNIILSVLIICSASVGAQTIYQLTISNLSKKPFVFKLNDKESKSIRPLQSITIHDTLGYDKYALSKLDIKDQDSHEVQAIQFVTEDGSTIKLEVSNAGNIAQGKGYKITGLPFANEQEKLVNEFFPKRNEFAAYVEGQRLAYNRLVSRMQKDSLNEIEIVYRKEYLSFIEKFIVSMKHSYVANYLFKSELLFPRNMLMTGKEKLISIFELFDTSYNKTEIGQYVADYVDRMRSTAIGSNIKNFKFKTEDLKEYDFYDYIKNSKVLLIFTSRGCRGCVEQAPIITKIEKALSPNIKIVYISLDRNVEDWNKTMESGKYTGIMTLNKPPYNYSVDLQNLFMVNFIPRLFLIDTDHKILYDNQSPYDDDDLKQLKKLLNVLEN